MKAVSFFKDICIFLVVLPLLSLVLICAAITSIWKGFLFLLVRFLYKDKLLSFLSPLDIFFYSLENKESISSHPRLFIPVTLILDGDLGEAELREHLRNEVINCLDDQERLAFGRLQQKIIRKFGYLFFVKDNHFQVENHVRTLEIPLDEAGVLEFIETQNCSPFKQNSPMWEIFLVPKYNGEVKTLLFFRAHHSFMDGFSILSIFQKGVKNVDTPNYLKKSSVRNIPAVPWSCRQAVVQAYQRTIGMPLKFFLEQSERKNLRTKLITETFFLLKTEKIPLEKFRNLKVTRGVSLTVAVSTAISAAMTSFFIDGTFETDGIGALTGIFTFPSLGKPSSSTGNNFICADLNFPIKAMTMEERLEKCGVEMGKTRNSVSPKVTGMMMAVGNVFPVSIYQKYFIPSVPDIRGLLVSNMPGPAVAVQYLGRHVIDVFHCIGANQNPWVTFSILSYNGNIRIAISGNKSIFKTEEKFEYLCASFKESINMIFECKSNPKSSFIIQLEK